MNNNFRGNDISSRLTTILRAAFLWVFPFLRWEGGSPLASAGWRRWYRRTLLKRDILLTVLFIVIPGSLSFLLFSQPSFWNWIQSAAQPSTTNWIFWGFNFAFRIIHVLTIVMFLHFLIHPGVRDIRQIHWRMAPGSTRLIYGQYALRAIFWISLVDVMQQIYGSYRLVDFYLQMRNQPNPSFSGWTLTEWVVVKSIFIYAPLNLIGSLIENFFVVALIVPYVMRQRHQMQSLLAGVFYMALTLWAIETISVLPRHLMSLIFTEFIQTKMGLINEFWFRAVGLGLIFWARWIARQTAGRFWEWPEMEGSVWSPWFFAEVTGLNRATGVIIRVIRKARDY